MVLTKDSLVAPQAEGDFTPILTEVLPLGQKLDFDLYIQVNGNFVLYASAGSVLGMEKSRQVRYNEIQTLYIKRGDPAPMRYYEANLARILREERIELEAKTQIFYNVATHLVKDVLEDPRSGTAIKRSKEAVQSLVDLILMQKEAFFNLMRITSHDYYTYTHSVNVCTLSVGLARRMGIRSRSDCTILGLGALLHDVGKCMIDLNILNKQGPLTAEEWKVLRKHPEWGADLVCHHRELPSDMLKGVDPEDRNSLILSVTEVSDDTVRIIEQHHESCNGQGYPCGLTDKEIHLFAKIVKIADVYDALTTNRCYQKACTPFQAVKRIKEVHTHAVDQKILHEFILLLGFGTER